MGLSIFIGPVAQRDLGSSAAWYAARRNGLDHEFLLEFDQCIRSIRSSPGGYKRLRGNIRQAVMSSRFPYVVVYAVEPDRVNIMRVFHAKRDPATKLKGLPRTRRIRRGS